MNYEDNIQPITYTIVSSATFPHSCTCQKSLVEKSDLMDPSTKSKALDFEFQI